jgi:hypothetical protein
MTNRKEMLTEADAPDYLIQPRGWLQTAPKSFMKNQLENDAVRGVIASPHFGIPAAARGFVSAQNYLFHLLFQLFPKVVIFLPR